MTHPRSGVLYVSLFLSPPIPVVDMEWYSQRLQLDDGQQGILKAIYHQYLEKDASLRERDVQPLYEESARIAATNAQFSDPEVAEAFRQLLMRRQEFEDRTAALETEMFNNTEVALNDSQLSILPSVRRSCERRRLLQVSAEYPGADVNLVRILARLSHDSKLSLVDENAFVAIVDEYESHATLLARRHYRNAIDTMIATSRLLAESHSARKHQAQTDPDQDAKVYLEIVDLSRSSVSRSKSLYELNVTYFERIAAALQEPHRTMFRAEFQHKVYPSVYPDPYDLQSVLASLIDKVTLTEEQVGVIEGLRGVYKEKQDHLSKNMVQEFLDWKELCLTTRLFDRDAFDSHKTKMSALQDGREEAAKETLKQINDYLGEPALEPIAKQLAAYEKGVAKHKPYERGDSFIP